MSQAFSDNAEQARGEHEQSERERRTVAELLLSRGQRWAAALVTSSSLTSVCVDNWNGGIYEAYLSVPVSLYDQVTDEIRDQVSVAIAAVYGPDCFSSLKLDIARADYRAGWDREFMEHLARDAATNSVQLQAAISG